MATVYNYPFKHPHRCDTCKRKFDFRLPYSQVKGFYCGDCEIIKPTLTLSNKFRKL